MSMHLKPATDRVPSTLKRFFPQTVGFNGESPLKKISWLRSRQLVRRERSSHSTIQHIVRTPKTPQNRHTNISHESIRTQHCEAGKLCRQSAGKVL